MLESIANLFIFISSLGKGTPDELDINDNIIKLRSLDWFDGLYQEHETAFRKNDDVRWIIGHVNMRKIMNNQKKSAKLKNDILKALET